MGELDDLIQLKTLELAIAKEQTEALRLETEALRLDVERLRLLHTPLPPAAKRIAARHSSARIYDDRPSEVAQGKVLAVLTPASTLDSSAIEAKTGLSASYTRRTLAYLNTAGRVIRERDQDGISWLYAKAVGGQ